MSVNSARRFYRLAVLSTVCLLLAAGLYAALSPQYETWRNGPVRWIMTGDEQKAWKNLKSDEEASHFIDLFWARRDPSQGTPLNEFHEEFLQRVKYADQNFAEGKKPGSMTERGQVMIVLGNPTSMSGEAAHAAAQMGGDASSGSVDVAARMDWVWEHADAAQYGMPKVEVVFLSKPSSETVYRDSQRPDFLGAAPVAIRKAVISPKMTEVPDWAPHGGLDPKITVAFTEQPAPGAPTTASAVPLPAAPAAPVIPPDAIGATRLTLVRNVGSLDAQAPGDPFDKMAPVGVFHESDDLGWAVRYCSGASDEPTLKFTLKLTGNSGNQSINRSAEPDEMVPDNLKSLPGCYVLRASVPLSGMGAGSYQLELNVKDPATGKSYDLRQPFRIE